MLSIQDVILIPVLQSKKTNMCSMGLKVEFECFSSCLASVQVCGSVGAGSQKPTPVNKRVVPNTSAHLGNSSLLFLQASGFTVMTLS